MVGVGGGGGSKGIESNQQSKTDQQTLNNRTHIEALQILQIQVGKQTEASTRARTHTHTHTITQTHNHVHTHTHKHMHTHTQADVLNWFMESMHVWHLGASKGREDQPKAEATAGRLPRSRCNGIRAGESRPLRDPEKSQELGEESGNCRGNSILPSFLFLLFFFVDERDLGEYAITNH